MATSIPMATAVPPQDFGIPSSPIASQEPAAGSPVNCSKCDRAYQATASNAGKSVRCACGGLVTFPQAQAWSPQAGTATPNYLSARPASGGAHQKPGGFGQPAMSQLEKENAMMDRYRANHPEEDDQGGSEREFDMTIIGGIGAMVGAVVWFVAGLYGGYIYFYPPVLFIIGLSAVIRGIFN